MKKLILFVSLVFSCALLTYGQSVSAPNAGDFSKLNWLEGTWTLTGLKPGRTGYERWAKQSEKEWKGIGVTLQGKDTVFVEKLTLLIKEGVIYYVADVKENKHLVYFKMTEIGVNGFTCENPEHDFPKKIVYRNDHSGLKATVSGNGKSFDYLFTKQ